MAAHHGDWSRAVGPSSKAITPPRANRADREVDLCDEQDHCLSYRQHHDGAQPKIYTRLLGRRSKCSATIWKVTATTTTARSTGRTPLSPLAGPGATRPGVYRHSDRARSSAGRRHGEIGGGGSSSVRGRRARRGRGNVGASLLGPLAQPFPQWRILQVKAAAARPALAGRHVLHHALLLVRVCSWPWPPSVPQVEYREPVCDLKMSFRLLEDDHHRQPAIRGAVLIRSSTCRVCTTPRAAVGSSSSTSSWKSTSPPWPPQPTAADLPRARVTGCGSSAPWSPRRRGRRPPSAPSRPRRAGRGWFLAKEHVLDDVQVVGQRQVLVDRLIPSAAASGRSGVTGRPSK